MKTVIPIKKAIIFLAFSLFIIPSFALEKVISPATVALNIVDTQHLSKTNNLQYDLLQKERERYENIRQNGGWKKLVPQKKFYVQGESATFIKQVKERLRASGHFTLNDTSNLFTPELAEAIKLVQKSFGFKENGAIDGVLVKELNVPVEKRLLQLWVNRERMAAMPAVSEGTRLVANIPEFKLHVYEGNKIVFDMAIVVGTEANKTETFNDEMQYIVFSPYWNVPQSIVKNEILPAMKRNRNYLRNNNYEQLGTENGLPVIRQKPGPSNSLGRVKFVFPNSHAIYFHDTPAKSLFSVRKRTFSHGCIRLAEPAKLAQYLLRNDASWNDAKIDAAMKSGKEKRVDLKIPVPISITYYTAWVGEDGLLHFREDVYGRDQQMAKAVAKKSF